MMYIGVEYERRFVVADCDSMDLIVDVVKKMGFAENGIRMENDFYFSNGGNDKIGHLKYCVNSHNPNSGRLEFKKNICSLDGVVISLEMGDDCKIENVPLILKDLSPFREYGREFNLNSIISIEQKRRGFILGDNMHSSVDSLMINDRVFTFIEFETSVPSPQNIDKLSEIANEFKRLTGLGDTTGNKMDYLMDEIGE